MGCDATSDPAPFRGCVRRTTRYNILGACRASRLTYLWFWDAVGALPFGVDHSILRLEQEGDLACQSPPRIQCSAEPEPHRRFYEKTDDFSG